MDLPDLISEDAAEGIFRVHRSAMTSSAIMELEQERIFDRCWLYVGHDSEIPEPGDFRRRTVAGRPLILVRDNDGAIRVFLNTCLHRGALVCREDSGNAKTFECFYHGWRYGNSGKLIGIPDPAGYSEKFINTERSLMTPPHIESYRGMNFVNFGADVPSLADYLGHAREIIDLTLDSAEPLGGWNIISGSGKFNVRANWKLLVENSIDNYHFRTVHQTYADYQSKRRAELGAPRPNVNRINNSRGLAFSNGHAAMLTQSLGRTIANPSTFWSDEAIAEVTRLRGELAGQFGEERGERMAEYSRFLLIFPNVAFHDTQSGFRIRQIWPITPDTMEVTQWEFAPRQETGELAGYRRENSVMFQGAGGFGTPDDIEALESCQQGYGAHELEWSDMSRGMHREPRSDDELPVRGFWREWHALIQGHAGAERFGDVPIPEPTPYKTGLT